ncbi:MAG: flagellar biosynthesis protein FlhF [Bdellovibrionaceae bacterium]|nr:flagellar biosynthesis protein FlhF [Pseudobdellovibrionaceae bacterium]
MNVKKFEARTMKEALDMVKTQLGPDAVILSAKEMTKGFGGIKSIEITAAYSENMLKQKEYVKSKMPMATQEQFNRSSAKSQKEVMKKVMHDQMMRTQNMQIPAPAPRRTTQASTMPASTQINYTGNIARSSRRYIDIDADHQVAAPTPAPVRATPPAPASVLTEQAKNAWNNMDVKNLKTEIEQLKEMILNFKSMPQNFAQSHPGAEFGINYDVCTYFQKLVDRGILPEVASDIILSVQENISPADMKKSNQIESWMARYILETTLVQSEVIKKYQLFMGPSASGKSTSMIKLACDLAHKKNKRVAIISTDTIKIGADEQMKVYSQMLNIPFVSVRSPADWQKVMPYLAHVDHVLVDFASLNLRSQEETNYAIQMLPPVSEETQTHLVLSCKSKDQDAIDMANKYRAFNYDDIIFTALDEVTQYGVIYNTVRKLNKPLFGFGIGSKIPDDFERATVERVLDLILEITKKSQSLEQTI